MMKPLFIGAALILVSCGEQRIVSEQELDQYILNPENGLIKHEQKNGIDIQVIYRPTELILAQQLSGVTDKSERMKTIQNFESLSYFTIKLSRQGQEIENAYAGNPEDFVKVVSYLSSGIARSIYLVNQSDTIPAIDAVYVQMFGATTATSLMAVFDANLDKKNGSIKLCFDDSKFGLGRNEFEFDLSYIGMAPTLNLN